jgi:hypothetical protein
LTTLINDHDAVGTAHRNIWNAVAVIASVDAATRIMLDRSEVQTGL